MDELRERMMRAADAADQAALPGFPTGPMSERWMNAFLAAIEQEGLRVVVADETVSSSMCEFRELVSGSEQWTLVYQQPNGSWHEVGREYRTSVLDYARESLEQLQKKWPDDVYALAIASSAIEFPAANEDAELVESSALRLADEDGSLTRAFDAGDRAVLRRLLASVLRDFADELESNRV